MKEKLFENVGGNQFKLNPEEENEGFMGNVADKFSQWAHKGEFQKGEKVQVPVYFGKSGTSILPTGTVHAVDAKSKRVTVVFDQPLRGGWYSTNDIKKLQQQAAQPQQQAQQPQK